MPDFTTYYDSNGQATGGTGIVVYLLFAIGMIGMLRKAGMPGWGGFIPIYNVYLYIKLGGVTGWAIFWLLVPFANIVAVIYFAFKVSAAYGHGILMAIFGLVLFTPIGALILGFGRSTYRLRRFDTGQR